MSIFFIAKGTGATWNPASVAERLFCDQAESVARELRVETGLGPIVSDEVVIDEAKFKLFAESFAGLLLRTDPESSSHFLLLNCFSIVGALAQKLGAGEPNQPLLARLVANGRRLVK